ncbi:MAG: hypothetical protein QOF30_3321 [Acidimicrobiaceae bacterium]|jgi:hypothetical protein|nr:hypothetical protein [Acidimicrobiaceae bacterium]
MEQRFEHDFSGVRVHTGTSAEVSARSLHALAYTVDRDIVFGAGQYSPYTASGQQLLAHELTHTLQPSPGVRASGAIGGARDTYEQQADEVGRTVAAGRSAARLLAGYGWGPDRGLPATAPLPFQGPGRQTGPPRPVVADATHVFGFDPADVERRIAQSNKAGSAPRTLTGPERSGLLSRMLVCLGALDRHLERAPQSWGVKKVTQSWGMPEYGAGDGTDSPATAASKNAHLLDGQDVMELIETMDVLLLATPESGSYRGKLKEMRDDLNAKEPDKVAAFVKEFIEATKEYLATSEGAEHGTTGATSWGQIAGPAPADVAAPGTTKGHDGTATAGPKAMTGGQSKVKVMQWVAYDASGNQFAKIRYSDGSTRFMMGSIYGVREIADQGPMEWKRVPVVASPPTQRLSPPPTQRLSLPPLF